MSPTPTCIKGALKPFLDPFNDACLGPLSDFDRAILSCLLDPVDGVSLSLWYVCYLLSGRKKTDKPFQMRVRRSVERLEGLGFVESSRIGSDVYVRLSTEFRVRFSGEVGEVKAERLPKGAKIEIMRNVAHNKMLLNTVLAYMCNLTIGRHWLFVELERRYLKVGKHRFWVLIGFIELGHVRRKVLVRFYGYNESVSRWHVLRDMPLYKWFRITYSNGLPIVFSASQVDGRARKGKLSAQALLHRKARAKVYTLGRNVRMPYLTREKRMERHERNHERWERGHEINPKRWKNPPHIHSPQDFYERFLLEKFAKVKQFRADIERLFYKANPVIEGLVERYRELKAEHFKVVNEVIKRPTSWELRLLRQKVETALRVLAQRIQQTLKGNGG